jgi:hypothetical protein
MSKIKHHLSKIKNMGEDTQRKILFAGIVVLLVVIAFKSGLVSLGPRFQSPVGNKLGVEIQGILATSDQKEQVKLYTDLINRVGPAQAQEDLFRSGLPFTGQTHLLNHTVGDFLYDKFGTSGLVQCKDYFLSSCYHGFLLHVIADLGMPGVSKSFAECFKEGPSVYSQCAHGIGHGFLANAGYKNLTKALNTCDEAVATMPGFPPFNCYDGVFMENIWAVHNGQPSPDRWIKESDNMYPCDDKRIDDKYILACWSNQPSLLFQQFRGDIKKVADVCSLVKNESYQQMCFDGLSRQINPLTRGESNKVFNLCSLMPNTRWENYCIGVNASATYAVGDRVSPFDICSLSKEDAREECFNRLFSNMTAYRKNGDNLDKMCSKITLDNWRKKCEDSF